MCRDSDNALYRKFYSKSIELGDYIAFILPINQFNNTSLYEFNLIYSENLGIKKYSDRNLHCCFNIYKRNMKGINKKPKYTLKDITLIEHHRTRKPLLNEEYDIRVCAFGSSLGKIVDYPNQFCREICIIINNDKFREKVNHLIITTDFKSIFPSISTPCIEVGRLYKYIKEQISEIK